MNSPTSQLASFLARAEQLLERIELLLPPSSPEPDWNSAVAFRWRKHGRFGHLQAIQRPATIRLADLHDIDAQKDRIDANTRQFIMLFILYQRCDIKLLCTFVQLEAPDFTGLQ